MQQSVLKEIKLRPNLGPVFILVSNISAIATLRFLRAESFNIFETLMILAIGNAICGLPVLVDLIKKNPALPTSIRNRWLIVFWSLSYVVNYGFYLLFPKWLSLPQIMIAQSIAPTAAAIITNHKFKNSNDRILSLVGNLFAIGVLVAIALSKARSEAHSWFLLYPFLLSCICFLGTNYSGRSLSTELTARWVQSRVAALNSILLLVFCLISFTATEQSKILVIFGSGIIVAVGILLAQLCFLSGLRYTEPYLAALLISTAVPLSLIAANIPTMQMTLGTDLGLATIYCLVVLFIQTMKRKEDRRRDKIFEVDS